MYGSNPAGVNDPRGVLRSVSIFVRAVSRCAPAIERHRKRSHPRLALDLARRRRRLSAVLGGVALPLSSNGDPGRTHIRSSRPATDEHFAEARSILIDGFVDLCSRRAHHSRVLFEIGRCACTTAIFGLHAGADPDDRSTWATLSRLHAVLGEVGFASRNRVDNFVAYLERYSFVEKRRSPLDRRVTLITPTERLVQIDAAFLDVLEAAARRWHGVDHEPGGFSARPGRHMAFRRETMLRLRQFRRAASRHREIVGFFERDSGCLVLLLLLQAASGDEGLDTDLRYDVGAALASVSRTHVRMLIEDAERAGLLRILEPGGRSIRLSPALRDLADRWLRDCLAFFGACERRISPPEAQPGRLAHVPVAAPIPCEAAEIVEGGERRLSRRGTEVASGIWTGPRSAPSRL